VLARCSWCFHTTCHREITPLGATKKAYTCGACAMRTVTCARACGAMARAFAGDDDGECARCAGVVPRSLHSDVDFDDDDVEKGMNPIGYCSWCGKRSRQRIVRWFTSRKTYASACARCARGTHACERCDDGFARIGDGRCVKCAGFVENWHVSDDAFVRQTRVNAWCSWCGERCAHAKRGTSEKATYECMVCGGGTAPCERCFVSENVMRKRSRPWGGGCARCRVASATTTRINVGGYVSIPTASALAGAIRRAISGRSSSSANDGDEIARKWLVRAAKREAADVRAAYVFETLERESEFRDKAYRAGLIRPFMLLATLPPRERVRLGMRLGVTLCQSSTYLDAHAEAWKLLREPMCGLQTRGGDVSRVVEKITGVGRGANWLDILYSALTLGASTGKCPAMDPNELATLPIIRSPGHALFALRVAAHPAVNAYEVTALRLVSHAQRGRLAPASIVTLDEVCKHPSAEVLKSRLRRAYPLNVDEISRYAVTAAFASSSWANSVPRAASPNDVQIIAEDIYGMLLEGKPLTRRVAGENVDDDIDDDAQMSRGAPSLLAALAASTSMGFASYVAAQFAPAKFAALTPRDVLDLTTGVRTPTLTSSGIFEPVAVMLLHNVLLAARGVHIDDHLPSDAKKLARDALNAMRSPSVAPTPRPTTSEGDSQSPDPDDSPWEPKYANLRDEDASARLEELQLQQAEESADMLQRYINSLSIDDLTAESFDVGDDDDDVSFDGSEEM